MTRTELHLDGDEWGEILYHLKAARLENKAGESYLKFLDSIILKLEAAGIQSNE